MALQKKVDIFTPVNVVGFLLTMMAGWIDIVGVKLFFNQRCAFMTGRASAMGENFVKALPEAFFIVMVVLSFMIGAGIAAKLTRKKGLIGGLTFTGCLVIFAGVALGSTVEGAGLTIKQLVGFDVSYRVIIGILLPMALGCQNAATTMTPINRTTHLTGPATDIGMNFALKNWTNFTFWLLHWIAFPLGAFIGTVLIAGGFNHTLSLVLPGIGVILIGIIQKATVNIPLK